MCWRFRRQSTADEDGGPLSVDDTTTEDVKALAPKCAPKTPATSHDRGQDSLLLPDHWIVVTDLEECRRSRSVNQAAKVRTSSPRRSEDREPRSSPDIISTIKHSVAKTLGRRQELGPSQAARTAPLHAAGMPVSIALSYRSSDGVLAIESTGFTENQVREAVRRQLATTQAEAS